MVLWVAGSTPAMRKHIAQLARAIVWKKACTDRSNCSKYNFKHLKIENQIAPIRLQSANNNYLLKINKM